MLTDDSRFMCHHMCLCMCACDSKPHLSLCLTYLPATSTVCCVLQAYPLDLVRTRLAVQTQGHYYHGILPTLQRIVADEGAVGLYRGLGATLLQVQLA
jgi:hypothetical protein